MNQNTELFEAIEQGDLDRVRVLFAAGTGTEARNADGTTALLWAIEVEQPGAVAELLKAGADPNQGRPLSKAERTQRDKKDRLETPLSLATLRGDVASLDLLLEAGATLEGSGCDTAACLNMIYSGEGQFAAIERLLDAGLDPKCKWKGTSLATLAGKIEYTGIAAKIQQLGVNVASARPIPKKKAPPVTGRNAGDFLAFVHDWGHPEWLLLAVEAPIDQAAALYAELRSAKRYLTDVPVRVAGDTDDEIASLGAAVQLEGCAWTLLIRHLCVPIARREIRQGEADAKRLSTLLGCRALAYFGEDTSYSMALTLFANGEAAGTRTWKSQNDSADAAFGELELYLPPCYARDDGKEIRLCALEGAQSRIRCAHILDLGDG